MLAGRPTDQLLFPSATSTLPDHFGPLFRHVEHCMHNYASRARNHRIRICQLPLKDARQAKVNAEPCGAALMFTVNDVLDGSLTQYEATRKATIELVGVT
jgi:hypothetical protein